MDDMTMMSVQCNIILNNGYMCGIQAVGRCATCQRAFCVSHQAHERVDYFGQPIPSGICIICSHKRQEEERKRHEEAYAPYRYFESGAAQTALRAAGVPTVDICHVTHELKKAKGFFGRREIVEVATPIERGWLLGT